MYSILSFVLNSPRNISEFFRGFPLLSYLIVRKSTTNSPDGSPSGSTLESKQCPVARRTPPSKTELLNHSAVSGARSTSKKLLIEGEKGTDLFFLLKKINLSPLDFLATKSRSRNRLKILNICVAAIVFQSLNFLLKRILG